MELLEKIFYEVGSFGPLILILSSLLLLRTKETYFNYYVIGTFLNILLNMFLKVMIKEPRPSVDKRTFDLALKHMQSKHYGKTISQDVFGMPSGHTQSVLFSTVYVLLILKDKSWKIPLFYIVLCLITMFQRVQYQFHTVKQVVVGSIIGASFAFMLYYLASQKIKGALKAKAQDNAR